MPPISTRLLPVESVHLADRPVAPVEPRLPQLPVAPINTVLRSPLPNIVPPSPDNLKQWNYGGVIPQYRFTPPRPL